MESTKHFITGCRMLLQKQLSKFESMQWEGKRNEQKLYQIEENLNNGGGKIFKREGWKNNVVCKLLFTN